MKVLFPAAGIVASVMLMAGSANAANLVQNGDFSLIQSGYGGSAAGSLATNGAANLSSPNWGAWEDATVQYWSVTAGSLNTVFVADALTNSAKYGVTESHDGYDVGPSSLVYTNGLGADPDGGNFVGLDGDSWGGTLYQTISGLMPGKVYNLTFYQASDHYQAWSDLQMSAFVVSLGSESYSAATMTPTTGTPTPWTKVSMQFTAASAAEVLSFTNVGAGAPPFALLDGVSLTEAAPVPEPSTWALLVVGMGGIGGMMRRSRRRPTLAA